MRKFVKMTNASLGTRESESHHEHKLKSWAETMLVSPIEEGENTEEMSNSLLLFGGQNLLNSLPR